MLNNLNSVPNASAPNVLFDFLIGLEAPVRSIYLDNATPRRATIGVGFNVSEPDVLSTVLEYGFGFVLGAGGGNPNPTDVAYRNDLLGIFQNTTLSAATMQSQANGIMNQRHAGDSFTFASGTAGLDRMRDVFNELAPKYADAAIDRLNSLGAPGFNADNWSWELIALTSLAYNGGPGIIGKNLAAAIRDDNRAAAWYEILFGSNKNNVFGLQNRRAQEATAFGLYDTVGGSTSINHDEAIQTYRFFTKARIDQALQKLNSQWHTDVAGNRTTSITPDEFAVFRNQFVNSLSPAASFLINEYVVLPGYGQSTDFNPLNIQVSSGQGESGLIGEDTLARTGSNRDLLIGAETWGDYLNGQGGDDVLYGGAGNDWLMGGKGNDILNGGLGKDVYYFRTGNGGDGNDKIIDPDGGWLVINDGLQELNAAGIFTRQKDTQGNPLNIWTRTLSGGSVLTLTHNSPWTLMQEDGSTLQLGEAQDDFHSGDFGIRLLDVSAVTDTYTGTAAANLMMNTDLAGWGEISDSRGFHGYALPDALNRYEGLGGADFIQTDFVNDLVEAGDGNDFVLALRGGSDIIHGGAGNDLIQIGDPDPNNDGGAAGLSHIPANNRDFIPLDNHAYVDGGDGHDTITVTRQYLPMALALNGATAGTAYLLADVADFASTWAVNYADWQRSWTTFYTFPDTPAFSFTGWERDGVALALGNDGGLNLYASFQFSVASFTGLDPNTHVPTQFAPLFGYRAGFDNDDATGHVLTGGTGNDFVEGGWGADFIDGGDDNDNLDGERGDDVILGGMGVDLILGGEGNDWADGGSESDSLIGEAGDDVLHGGDGNDELMGDSNFATAYTHGNDQLYGEGGDDQLIGNGGNDLLIGGIGLDYLDGGDGDDTYSFKVGDSPLVGGIAEGVNDSAGTDHIAFGAGIGAADINILQIGQDMAFNYSGTDWLYIFGGMTGSIETFDFVDGTQLSWTSLVGSALGSTVNVSTPATNVFLVGGAAGDTLTATGGGATFSGGKGDDILTGAGGGNAYLYSLGDGTDEIYDTGSVVDSDGNPVPNILKFGEGITEADISLGLGSLLIRVGSDPSDAIHIANFNPEDVHAQKAIDLFEFADGTMLSYEQLLERGFDLSGTLGDDSISGTNINDRIEGGAGNDTLTGGAGDDMLFGQTGNDSLLGGAGDDFLEGGAGDDIYFFNLGDGVDTLLELHDELSTDVLRLGNSIIPGDIALERVGDDLELRHANGVDKVIVANWFHASGDYTLDRIEFADGTKWNTDDIAALLETGAIEGGAGDDLLTADSARLLDFVVRARGTMAAGMAPEMGVWLDGQLLDTVQVASGDYVDYMFSGNFTPSQVSHLDVVFLNDAVIDGEDRNLYIDSITFGERSFRPTDPGVTYDRGRGANAFDGVDTRVGQVGMYWGGALRFDLPADLAGVAADDAMLGRDGDDTLNGGGGDDQVYGGNGNDKLLGGSGADVLEGEAGNDSLHGGADADVLLGGDGDDALAGDGVPAQRIVVRARGSLAAGVAPSMTVRLDGVALGTLAIGDVNFADYEFFGDFQAGSESRLDVVFGNDAVIGGEDRNLFVESVQVNGQILSSTSAAIYDRGKADAAFDGVDVIAGQTGMYWNGALRFSLADGLFGLAGDDTLIGGAGNDRLAGGEGNDLYVFNRGDGSDTWTDNDASAGNVDMAQFGSGIAYDQIWFRQVGNDLEASIIGTADKARIKNWFADSAYHIERFEAGDGKVLLDSQVDALVSAMAGFAPPAAGQTTLPAAYQDSLTPVLAANWH